MSIQRYDSCCCVGEEDDGEFVYYDEHKLEIDALQAEIVRLKSLLECDLDDMK